MEKYTNVRLSTKHRERWKRQLKLLSQWFIWCLKSIRQSHLMNLERSQSSCHLLRPPLVSPRLKWREYPVRNPEERHCSPSSSLSSIPTMEIKSSECGTAWVNSILLNSLMNNWILAILGSILGLHWDAFVALFSVTGSGFQVSPGKGCGTQNPLFIMIILKVYKCVWSMCHMNSLFASAAPHCAQHAHFTCDWCPLGHNWILH